MCLNDLEGHGNFKVIVGGIINPISLSYYFWTRGIIAISTFYLFLKAFSNAHFVLINYLS